MFSVPFQRRFRFCGWDRNTISICENVHKTPCSLMLRTHFSECMNIINKKKFKIYCIFHGYFLGIWNTQYQTMSLFHHPINSIHICTFNVYQYLIYLTMHTWNLYWIFHQIRKRIRREIREKYKKKPETRATENFSFVRVWEPYQCTTTMYPKSSLREVAQFSWLLLFIRFVFDCPRIYVGSIL